MNRTMNAATAYTKKFKTFDFNEKWASSFGTPEKYGAWLLYGEEKNGKTWFALKLASYLSTFSKTLYISAEEGLSYSFVEAMKRAQIDHKNRSLQFTEYEPISDLSLRLKKQRAPKVVIIDNTTVYQGELTSKVFQDLIKEHPTTLFIFIAHADRSEPSGATAKLIKKLSKIIIRVEGLKAFIGGRCPGGSILIDKNKAELYHGTDSTK